MGECRYLLTSRASCSAVVWALFLPSTVCNHCWNCTRVGSLLTSYLGSCVVLPKYKINRQCLCYHKINGTCRIDILVWLWLVRSLLHRRLSRLLYLVRAPSRAPWGQVRVHDFDVLGYLYLWLWQATRQRAPLLDIVVFTGGLLILPPLLV